MRVWRTKRPKMDVSPEEVAAHAAALREADALDLLADSLDRLADALAKKHKAGRLH
ncbi:MAG: hypothetical protein ACREDY_05540 [Bradyrhizobium sp.]